MPGFIGMPELLLLGLLALILFGPKRLPEMGRGLGKGMREFKDSITGDSHSGDLDPARFEIPAGETHPQPTIEEAPVATVATVEETRHRAA